MEVPPQLQQVHHQEVGVAPRGLLQASPSAWRTFSRPVLELDQAGGGQLVAVPQVHLKIYDIYIVKQIIPQKFTVTHTVQYSTVSLFKMLKLFIPCLRAALSAMILLRVFLRMASF